MVYKPGSTLSSEPNLPASALGRELPVPGIREILTSLRHRLLQCQMPHGFMKFTSYFILIFLSNPGYAAWE